MRRPDDFFKPGDIIDSHYRISRLIGEGTFGMVFEVADRDGTPFALKMLKLWEVPDEIRDILMARFDMEFETASIDSPYLVKAFSHGTAHGNPYILMEYCPYGDLLALSRKQRVDLPKAAVHILTGLSALHARGKVHRDLKPQNVLVKAGGDFALTDFGISGDRNKRMTEHNAAGKPKHVLGTYAYMPPEQMKSKREATVLPTTDIFSFGVLIYKLLTGALPYGTLHTEPELVDYLLRARKGEWNRDALLLADGGTAWQPLVEACLHPDYTKRPQTAREVIELVPGHSAVRRAADETPDFKREIQRGLLLRVMQGDEHGTVFHLDDMARSRAVLTIGRKDPSAANDIQIAEKATSYVSRRHCTLELARRPGQWIIRDGQWDRLGSGGWTRSTNGTFVNSREVTDDGLSFSPGDIISIGDTKLRAEAY